MPFSPSRWLKKIGGTLTGLLQFSGTTHAGIKLNALTTVQRDALTASNGMLIYNTTTARLEMYQGGEWVNYVKVVGDTMTGLLQWSGTGHAGLKLNSLTTAQRNALTPANGMLIYNTTTSKVQQYIGGAWADVASGSGTLSNWTESAPTNGGAEFAKFAPSSGTANVGVIIAPKGTGAFMLDTPDGADTGGNNRGSYAVDLQLFRNEAAQVASGQYSFAAGWINKASATGSVAIGTACMAEADTSVAIGYNAQTGGPQSIAIGTAAVTTGQYAVAIGLLAHALEESSFAFGYKSYATRIGEYSFGGQNGGASKKFVLANDTTDATQTELFLDNASARVRVGSGNDGWERGWAFTALVVGKRNDATDGNAGYAFRGVIKRDTSTATTVAIVGTVEKTVLAETDAAWDAEIDADTTNGSLRVRVTGEVGKTISWTAVIEVAET